MALVTTVGSATANSYNSLDEMATFFAATQWAAVWSDASDKQEALAIEGMLTLEAQNFLGTKALLEQALQWPRVGGGSQSRVLISGLSQTYGLYDLKDRFWASDAVPQPVKNAQCWFSLAALFSFDAEDLANTDIETSEFWAGSVRIAPTDKTQVRRQTMITSARQRAFQELAGLVVEAGAVKRLVRC